MNEDRRQRVEQLFGEAAALEPDVREAFLDGACAGDRELPRYAEQHELGIRERLELMARVCDAVHHAHQKGIIHRDLKPDNVLVVEEATPASLIRPSAFVMLGQDHQTHRQA